MVALDGLTAASKVRTRARRLWSKAGVREVRTISILASFVSHLDEKTAEMRVATHARVAQCDDLQRRDRVASWYVA